MKNILFLILSLFILFSCSSQDAEEIITDNEGGTKITTEEVEVVEETGEVEISEEVENPNVISSEEVQKVNDVNQLTEAEDESTHFEVKNGIVLQKEIIDSLVSKCEYFEGEIDYVFEEGEKVTMENPFLIKNHLYDSVTYGWCPGLESDDEKRAMIDTLITKQLPEKFKQFVGIDSLNDIDVNLLNIDLSQNTYKQEILLYAALYMYTLGDDETETYNKYLDMYNEFAVELATENGFGSEELYFPILITAAARDQSCKEYINTYLIQY